jgi:hypothetical protein
MPFTLAGKTEVKGVGDRLRLGRVGMFWAFGVELELAPFDDTRVGAVASRRQAEASDLVEEVGQEAVEKKGVAS